MANFNLHPRLNDDTIEIKDLHLSKLLLMNDSNYPWFILVPRINNISEIHELSEPNQQQLIKEISTLSNLVSKKFNADKINVGALGNMVPQLHIHVIARYKSDPSWPQPIWGKTEAQKYQPIKITEIKNIMSNMDIC